VAPPSEASRADKGYAYPRSRTSASARRIPSTTTSGSYWLMRCPLHSAIRCPLHDERVARWIRCQYARN
jgi:hypothetical protein